MKHTDLRRRIFFVVALGAVLVLAGLGGGLAPLSWVFDRTVMPVGAVFSQAGSAVGGFFGTLGQVQRLSDDNSRLERENADLRGRLASTADAKRENADLRRELGLREAGTPKQVAADVIVFQPDSYRQFITLNRGTNDGLKVGQAALSDGVVIGTISAVSAGTAKLQLITDPEFALTVRDQERGALGVIHGQLGGGLSVEHISATDVVSPGDTIATAGLGGIVPSGLLIGQVQSVNAQTGGIFKSAQVTAVLRAQQLRFVFVVIGS